MWFLFSGVFWGAVLILLGLSVIVNIVFHISIPVFRIVIALILIFLGIQVLTGHRWVSRQKTASIFRDEKFANDTNRYEYSIVFGKGTIDLTTVLSDTSKRNYKISTAFGSSVVVIPAQVPVIVSASSAFGGLTLPNGNTVSFGEYVYKNKLFAGQADALAIRIDLAFGACKVVEK